MNLQARETAAAEMSALAAERTAVAAELSAQEAKRANDLKEQELNKAI
jgi:hypothetical protein